jgi:hypothetical protein
MFKLSSLAPAILARAGYVSAAELTAANERVLDLSTQLANVTTAQKELAILLADVRDELGATEKRRLQLQGDFEAVNAQRQTLAREHDALLRESCRKDETIGNLTQRVDEQNEFIAQLQRERPQMRLVRPASETRGVDDESAPADDEVIVPEHSVEMSARVIVISFEGKTFWTLSVDDHTFKVAVHDRAFLNDPSHKFAKGSIIRGRFLETMLRRADGEPYTRRTLEEVLDVIQPSPSTTEPLFAAAAAAERN